MNRALIVLGGEAPGAAFLRELSATCNYVLCADHGLDAALAAIDAQHGGTEGFLREGLQLPPALLEQFRRSVLR